MINTRKLILMLVVALFASGSLMIPRLSVAGQTEIHESSGQGMFIENVGQFTGEGRFVLMGDKGYVWAAPDGIWITRMEKESVDPSKGRISSSKITRGFNIKLWFKDGNPDVQMEPFGSVETHISYLKGKDPSGWYVDVPVWSGVRYIDIYPGIDLLLEADSSGRLGWHLEAQASADFNQVKLVVEGADKVLAGDEEVRFITSMGEFDLPLPQTRQETIFGNLVSGKPIQVYEKFGDTVTTASTDILVEGLSTPQNSLQGAEDLLFSTYLGGSSNDTINGIATNELNDVFVTGETTSADFPLSVGAFDSTVGLTDAFVVRMNDDGNALIYATFLGGSHMDGAEDIAVQGITAYVVGSTYSDDFPLAGTKIGEYDAFIAALNETGTNLIFSKLHGGTGNDYGFGIDVESGYAYITGTTSSSDIPGGYTNAMKGFAAKFNSSGNRLYASVFGGRNEDAAYAISVSGGNAFITGESDSPDLGDGTNPVKFFDDAYVVKLGVDGKKIFGFMIGGTQLERGNAIVVDDAGRAIIVGSSDSTDMPVNEGSNAGGIDALIAVLNGSGTAWDYVTYLGGSGSDVAQGVALDGAGGVQVAGSTSSANFPTTTDVYQSIIGGGQDAFISRYDLQGSAPSHRSYSSYLGGTDDDVAKTLSIDLWGYSYIAGYTSSADFPVTAGVYDTSLAGSQDGFLSKMVVGPVPGVVLKKYTNDSDADLPPGPYILKNGAVSWKYNIYNTGGSDLNSIVLSDNVLGTITCPLSSLAPGASMTCTATGTAVAGQYENLGTVVAQPPGELLPVTDEDYSHYFGADPKITIIATTEGLDGRNILVGQTAAITYVVNNTGNVPLGNITVTDDAGITVSCPMSTLDSVQQMTCTSSILVTAGLISHTANVTADPPSGLSAISASDTTSHFGAAPSILLTNKVSLDNGSTWNDSNTTPTSLMLLTGNAPKFQLSVTNNGNVDLTNITVSDSLPIANLAKGATVTLPVVTGAWESGERQNLKSASGSYTDGLGNIQALNSSDPAYYYGASPALTIQKDISLNGGLTWLDTTTGDAPTLLSGTDPQYRITVQNTGNVALLTTITDAYLNFGTSCQPTTLQPQGTQVCTASKTWAANLQTNTAHTTASFTDSASHSMNLDVTDLAKYFGASPALTFEKYVSVNGGSTWLEADTATGPTLLSGYAAPQYKVTITNTGNVAVTGISVTDSVLTLTGCAAPFDLVVSGSKNCTATAVWGAGQHENTASLNATYTDSAAHTYPFALTDKAYYFGADPQLSVTKDVSVDGGSSWLPADSAPGPYLLTGQDQPQFRFTLTNTGNVSLSATLSDSSITIPAPCATGMLAPSANRQCTVTGAWAAGSQVNTAQASASYSDTPGNLTNVSVSNQAYYYGAQPQLLLKKYVSGNGGTTWDDAETQPGPYFLGSAVLKYKLVLDNTGNVTVSGLTWSDPAFSLAGCTLPSTLTPEAAPVECILTGTWKAGQVDNLATAGGSYTDSAGHQASPSDTDAAHYFGAQPGVSIVKTTNGQDANTTPGPNILVGDTVTWEYTITNTGNVPLTGIAVSDDNGTPLNSADDFTASCGSTGLATGANQTCTANGTAIEGQYENYGTVSAQPTTGVVPIGLLLSNSDVSHYFGARISMTLVKTTNDISADNTPPGPFIPVGQPVTWNYSVTNTSNISIGPINVLDDMGTPSNPADDQLACTINNLAPGQSNNSNNCKLQATAIAGQYANTGRAEMRMFDKDFSAFDMGHYYGYDPNNVLVLTVLINGQVPPPPPGIYLPTGDEISFVYTVFNTSPKTPGVTVTNINLIDTWDNQSVTCLVTELAPLTETTCTRTLSALADGHTHVAQVTGWMVDKEVSDSISSSYFGTTPGITLDVHINGQDPTSPLDLPIKAGSTINWDYFIQNTSNILLTGISLIQNSGEVSCPKTELTIGESMTCSLGDTAQSGAFTNQVTVKGVWPDDLQAFYGYADSYYFGVVPGVTLDVNINGSPATSPPGPEIVEGQTVTYSIDVSNTGNYLLDNIVVSLDGTPLTTCGTSLGPEAVMSCEETETAVLGPQTRVITVSGTVNGETINAEKTVYYTGKEDLYFVFLPLILR